MTRKTKRGKIAAKVLAAILSVTMGLSTLSTSAAGSVAFAQEAESLEVLTSELDAAEDTVSEETEEDDAVDAASEEAGNFGETAEPETEESEAETSEDVDAEASEEEAEASEEETEEVETVEEEDNISLESTDYENLVEFTTETSEADGIKTTVSKWDFATAKNTGKSTATGDTISGIVVGGGSGRVILDAGKDLNVKNNSTAETTGVIYLPIADDTNVVTINIMPMDKDISRYVTVGSFDSDVTLVDNGNDPASQTVTFKSDLVNYVVDSAVGVEGRYIPLYSHGNFKTAYIELIETDATTIVEVSGKLTGAGADKVTGLKFKNLETEESYECAVGKDNTYSISLPNEYQYAVSASGTLEYGIDETDNGNIVDLSVGNDKTKEQDFVLVPLDVVRISGTFDIEKIDNANPISSDKLKVTLVPKKNTLDNIEVPVTKTVLYNDFSYTFKNVALLPGEEYSVKLTNANDYEVTEITIGDEAEELLVEEEIEEEGANNTINIDTSKENVAIKATGKPLYKVTLEAVTHNLKAVSTVKALTVKNLDDDYTYSFDKLSGSKLEIEVRDGLYEVTEITSTGSYEPYEHFEVKGEAVSENMYLRDTSEKKAVSYKSEVTVGKNSCDYTTIYDALDAIGRMDRGDKRVTVVLKDEYYQEQVVVDEPNITFTSRRSEGSTISWYYGLGGDAYYSAYLNTEIDKNHLFYDEAHAVDQYESTTIGQTPGNWGSTVNLKSTATGFRAENITFENSFNFYISEVEKDDIAVSGNILDRKAEGADPTLYKSKERACTMYNRGADQIEFYNCSFISSQDTLYTGDKDEDSYYYNCVIEGTTDFICGDGNAVFDNCDIVLYGFSDQSKSDLVILASKGSASKGYLFNYCTVSLDTREGIQPTTSAYLGRPWGTSDEKVAFMNTILESDFIQAKGWTTMNTVPSLNLGLHEYRTRLMDGTKVDLSGRVATNIGSDKQGTAGNYVLEDEVGYTRADYMSDDWTPSYYAADYADLNEQVLRYNALVGSEAYAQADAKKKTAVENAYKAIQTGLFVKDQSKVDTFAANLEKAIDDIKGKDIIAPVSSLKSGTYTLSRVTSLTSKTEGASIYYTTDGTDPSYEVTKDEEGNDVEVINGTLYTAPVVITDSLTLKAIAVAEGSYVSEISVYNYVIEDPSAGGSGGTYVLESSALTPFAQGAKADGDSEKAGTDNYFTVIYSTKSKVDSSSKTWGDGYSSSQRINFGGIASLEKNSIMFTTGAAAAVKVWWAQGGEDSRQITILDNEGNAVATTTGTWTKNAAYISELALDAAGTYYLGSAINNNYIFKVEVVEESSATSTEYDLQTKDLTAFAQGAKADGASEKAGTDEYFTVIYSAKSKVDSSSKTWEDGYSSGQRINFGGTVSTAMNAVSFTTQGPATVDIWWAAGDAGRQMGIISTSGEDVAVTDVASTKNTAYKSTLEVSDAGTYYLGSKGGNNYLFRIYVTETAGAPEKPDRGDWADVPAPFISDVQVDGGKINVTVQAFINYNGGDSLLVDMMDEKSDAVDTQRTAKAEDKMEKVLTFTPSASGSYSFIATLTREGEESKSSLESEVVTFALPLVKPNITAVTNKGKDSNGKGKLEVVWTKVNEAKKYDVEIVQIKEEEVLNEETGVKEKVKKETVLASAQGLTDREVVLGGLPIDEKVTVKVYAVRDEDRSDAATKEVTVTGNNDRTWSFSSYGSNASTGDSATVNADGSISIKTPSSTKIVPGSTDGLGYYYTKIDPSENFTFTAQFRVDGWPYDNGQEGMGLMVADAVGEHGDGAAFWNNSYMAAATQIQYN